MFEKYPGRIACLILEPATAEEPRNDFLRQLKLLCEKHGSLMILDEMITGFRWNISGGQEVYGVVPDPSTFGKAMGNGFAIAALVRKREIMKLGGLDHAKKRVFLLSTTHGAETHALAAARETLHIYERCHVVEQLYRQGERLRVGINACIAHHGVGSEFAVVGRGSNLIYATKDADGKSSQGFRTLFLQKMIRGRIIAPSFVVSFSHADAVIDQTIEVVDRALGVCARALAEGLGKYLVGRPVKPVNRRFN